MQRELPFRVLLPAGFDVSTIKRPVLYLLHGLFGSCDNWLELTGIETYLQDKEFAVILPDGGDKWYSDSATIEKDKFETSFLTEFMPAIERDYRIGGSKTKRAIAGLSMGGFGAFKFALKRPEFFIFAGSMSGAFDAPGLIENADFRGRAELLPSVLEVFGNADSHSRFENDLFEIIRRVPAEKISGMPFLYLDCGTEDAFLPANIDLSEALRKKNIAFKFAQLSGGHDWSYWDRQLQVILKTVNKIFREKRAENSEGVF